MQRIYIGECTLAHSAKTSGRSVHGSSKADPGTNASKLPRVYVLSQEPGSHGQLGNFRQPRQC